MGLLLHVFLATLAASTPPTITPVSDADDTPGVRATFDVEAPASVVLDLLWDVSRFQRIFPDILALQVVTEAPSQVDVRFTVDAVVTKPSYTLRRRLDVERGEISWFSVAGDLKRVVGKWTVRPASDARRCVVIYESFVDIGLVGISTVYRNIVTSKLHQMVERVRVAAADAVGIR